MEKICFTRKSVKFNYGSPTAALSIYHCSSLEWSELIKLKIGQDSDSSSEIGNQA